MHQSILMNTDIHKCPEINDITDSSLKDHTFFEVFHIKYICTKYRFRHLITWISCRFFQFFYNIAKCRLTNSQLFRQLLIILDLFGNTTQLTAGNIFRCVAKLFKNFLCCIIAFRMHTCRIKRILASGDTRKTCTLLKRFRSEFRYFEKLTTAFKSAVFFTVCNNIFRDHFTDAGNVFQKGRGCCIQVHTDFIYTVLYNTT